MQDRMQMCRSEKLMIAFVAAVIIAGLFGPWMISLALAAATGLVWTMRRRGRDDRSGAL